MIFVPNGEGLEVLGVLEDTHPEYRPLEDSIDRQDLGFVWSYLPDDLSEMSAADQRYFEQVWTGMVQTMSALLLDSSHADQVINLTDFPKTLQRKWLYFQFEHVFDLRDPSREVRFTLRDEPGSRLLEERETTAARVELTQASRQEGASVALGAPHTQKETLRGQLLARFLNPRDLDVDEPRPPSPSDPEAWTLLGYRGDRTGIFAAVSTRGRVASVLRRPDGVRTWAVCDSSLPGVESGSPFELSFWVTPRPDGQAWLDVSVESDGDRADLRTLVDFPFEVTSVDFGPFEKLAAPVVGTVTPEVTRFALELDSLTILDVSVDHRIQFIPSMQSEVTSRGVLYRQDFDYFVTRGPGRTVLQFVEQSPPGLWAEHVAFNMSLLEKLYSPLVGDLRTLSGEDSDQLQNRIVGTLYGLLSGPHLSPLAVAVSSIAGVPIALEDGIVLAVSADARGPFIKVQSGRRTRRYRFPSSLRPEVSVGENFRKFQPLTESASLDDWRSGDSFLSRLRDAGVSRPDIAKLSALIVDVPIGNISDDSLEDALAISQDVREYLNEAVAVWVAVTRILIFLSVRLRDNLNITDSTKADVSVTIRSALTDVVAPVYNEGYVYDGSFPYDAGDAILQDQMTLFIQNHTPVAP